jgi:O-antigen/teichoic acid export membrane protein
VSSLLKNSVITFTSRILVFILWIAISIILARSLGPELRGVYALIIFIHTVLLKLGSLGIESANTYFIGSQQYKIKDIVSNSLINCLLISSGLILSFYIIYNINTVQAYFNLNQIEPFYLWLIVLTIPFSLLYLFLLHIVLGMEEIIKYNKINIFRYFFHFITLLLFLLILKQKLFGAVISHVLTTLTLTLFIIFLARKITKIGIYFNYELSKSAAKYGFKAYFGNLAQFLNYRLDFLLISAFLVPNAVGFYAIAVGMAETMWILPGAIATVLFPRVSSLNDTDANSLTPRIARHTYFIIFILVLILFFTAKLIIKFFFGSEFLPSVKPLLLLLPGIIALAGSKTLTADLAGRGKPQIGTFAAFTSLAINIPLNLYLIPKWGISGAAFASSAAYIAANIIVIIAFVKTSKKSWFDILIIKKIDLRDYKYFLLNLGTILRRTEGTSIN